MRLNVVFVSLRARYFYFARKDFKRRLRGGKAEIRKVVYKEEPIGGIGNVYFKCFCVMIYRLLCVGGKKHEHHPDTNTQQKIK